MAEKNYIMQAVVPEAPRIIDEQQLYVYIPQGSTDNFGVFKPDGQQFVITNDGILRVDASKLIAVAEPSAVVVEDGGATSAEVVFTEADSTLMRKFQFLFKNIKGDIGKTALMSYAVVTADAAPVAGQTVVSVPNASFNRAADVGDGLVLVYNAVINDVNKSWLVACEVTEVGDSLTKATVISVSGLINGADGTDGKDYLVYMSTWGSSSPPQMNVSFTQAIDNFSRVPVIGDICIGLWLDYAHNKTYFYFGKVTSVNTQSGQVVSTIVGFQDITGPRGVGITNVTQTGVQGGTLVTITLSDGQTTSFTVYNGINTNFQVVDELPTENISTSTIYLILADVQSEDNIYDEYIYIDGDWEHIGSTSVDLSDYVTKTYFNQNVGDATKNYVVAQIAKIHNLYIEMYESGSVPAVGQALTLTNSNFARVPVVGQYFGLLEVVNTKDKYYSICQILSVDTTTCSAKVVAVTEVTNGTEIDVIKASIATLTTDLAGKLDKVATATTNPQFYAKAPDGSQAMTEIKGGNGITVDAASDNKFLELKVGDTVNLTANQTLTIANNGLPMLEIGDGYFNFDPDNNDSFQFRCYGNNANQTLNQGPNINLNGTALCDNSNTGMTFEAIAPVYEITGIPISSTSGTLPNNASWTWFTDEYNINKLRILFNHEFYQLADNEHTTGTLVFSHVGYEGSQLIIKTITITLATRGWVLTTIKPAEEPYHVELTGDSGTITTEQYQALLADNDSYILHSVGVAVMRLARAVTVEGPISSLQYQKFIGGTARTITIQLSGAWTKTETTYQSTSNKTTTLSASSTDTQYPSAKAVVDYTTTAIASAITTTLNTPV